MRPDRRSWCRLEARPVRWRQVVARRVLTQLQRANVRDYCPALVGSESSSVRIHDAVAVRDDIEEVTVGSRSQSIGMQRGRRGKAAVHDQPIAVADGTVTGRAIDLEALSSLSQPCQRRGIRIVAGSQVAFPASGVVDADAS